MSVLLYLGRPDTSFMSETAWRFGAHFGVARQLVNNCPDNCMKNDATHVSRHHKLRTTCTAFEILIIALQNNFNNCV